MSQPDELPSIGASATRALTSVGITPLSQLTDHRAEELLKLQDMGPRAIKIPSPGPSRPRAVVPIRHVRPLAAP
jgi:hypothetical protein